MHWQTIFPILQDVRKHKLSDWRDDIIAGLTVAIILVPQGMAYAFLAGMPPIYGLYTGLVPLLIYAFLGTSRQMSIGPVAVSSLLILAGIGQLTQPGSPDYIGLVLLTGLLIGLFQCVLGMLRLGFLVNFLSHPVIAGFTSAAAIIIAVSQLKDLLGFDIPRFSHTSETFVYALQHLDQTNWVTLSLCIGSMITILFLRKLSKAIPGALIVVLVGTILAWVFDLENWGLDIVKEIPNGLPVFELPNLTMENAYQVLPTVITVAIIGVVESMSIAKVLEAKHPNYDIKPNQELFALGISKTLGAFFQAMPSSGSFTRSAVNNDAGAKSGVASLVTVFIIAMTLIFLTPLFYYLPKAVLAAIILVAVKSLFAFDEAKHLWKIHKVDFTMMIITFVITLVLGIEEGVIAGVLISILAVLYKSAKPHIAVLGNFPGTTIYRNVKRFDEVVEIEGLLIIRFDDQLYFSNAECFKDAIKQLTTHCDRSINTLIIDSSSIHDMDSSGLAALEEVFQVLKRKGIRLQLSGVIGPVRDLLFKSDLMNKIGPQNQFMTVHEAVTAHQKKGKDGFSQKALQTNCDP